jgi:fructokinase
MAESNDNAMVATVANAMVATVANAEVEVVGIGELLWDLLPGSRRMGGAPANFAFHTNIQGIAATVVSAVGDDAPGREIIARMAALNLDPRYLSVPCGYPTGSVHVRVDANGVPEYVIEEDVAWDHIAWTGDLATLAKSVRAVCFGTLGQRSSESRSTIRRFLDSTQPTCLRVCDINLRQSYFDADILRDSLCQANVLKLNHEELPVVARSLGIEGAPEAMLSTLRASFHLDLVALTLGGEGSALLTAERVSHHPGYPVEVVDTVGAGDAFTAALVVGLLRGHDLDTIHADANRAAARVCAHAGAIPGVESETALTSPTSPRCGERETD